MSLPAAAPLLTSSESDGSSGSSGRLRKSANGIGRRSAMSAARMIHRDMGEPSVRVREAAEEQVEEQQSVFAYSLPFVVFALLWNSILLIVVLIFLFVSRDETTSVPLRAWLIIHEIQRLAGVVCHYMEYLRRQNLANTALNPYTVAKLVEFANSVFALVWWIMGIYWVSSGGSTLAEDAPKLHWICVALLVYDGVFVILSFLVGCCIGSCIALCLPRIIAILHALPNQERATTEDIEQLPKFIYKETVNSDNLEGSSLHADKTVCAICLSKYKDTSELRQLPCFHFFHSKCVDKWLCIKATCPLCNCKILNRGEQTGHVHV